MKAVIIAGGEPPPGSFLLERVQPGDLVVCADAGYSVARRWAIPPDLVVGDLDSLPPLDRTSLEHSGVPLERHPPDKDRADLELALDAAVSRGAREVEILGALGGRLDHQLFNVVAVLSLAQELGAEARIVDPGLEVRLVRGRCLLEGKGGWTCSLLPLDRTVSGITTRGLQYSLRSGTLHRASTRGLSNRVLRSPAVIVVEEGSLLLVLVAPQ